ncbi:hypothetical protein SH661x_004318 [Planctomicrobium sp. SH661]|uniref:hypothetical protein n=1 Tax=Planctomicrobium sp. SH661 TaxID=3448124 RepID=UPI003F5C8288
MLSVANLQENDDVLSRFTYTYDPVGNRLSEAREDSDLRLFVYDPTNQLISERRTDGDSWETLTADQWGDLSVLGWGTLPPSGSTLVMRICIAMSGTIRCAALIRVAWRTLGANGYSVPARTCVAAKQTS